MGVPAVRLDFEPLRAATGIPYSEHGVTSSETDVGVLKIAAVLGVSYRSVQRWKERGIPIWQADRAACRLDLHPSNLWPEWFPELETT